MSDLKPDLIRYGMNYFHEDKVKALTAERDALKAEVERLRGALVYIQEHLQIIGEIGKQTAVYKIAEQALKGETDNGK